MRTGVVAIEVAHDEDNLGIEGIVRRVEVWMRWPRPIVVLVRNAPYALSARLTAPTGKWRVQEGRGGAMLTIAPRRYTCRAIAAPHVVPYTLHEVEADGTLLLHVDAPSLQSPPEAETALLDLVKTKTREAPRAALVRAFEPRCMGHARPVGGAHRLTENGGRLYLYTLE